MNIEDLFINLQVYVYSSVHTLKKQSDGRYNF